jgi:hypothetical protein
MSVVQSTCERCGLKTLSTRPRVYCFECIDIRRMEQARARDKVRHERKKEAAKAAAK